MSHHYQTFTINNLQTPLTSLIHGFDFVFQTTFSSTETKNVEIRNDTCWTNLSFYFSKHQLVTLPNSL